LVAIAVQNVGFGVVVVFLLALLVIRSLDGRIGDLVNIEGGQFDFPPPNGQDSFDEPAFAQMTLDFGNE
jgi:hypothetical protein